MSGLAATRPRWKWAVSKSNGWRASAQFAPWSRWIIYYAGPAWLNVTADAPFASLGRLRPNRVLYRQPGPYLRQGRPAVHGPALKLRQSDTWYSPDEALYAR